MSTPCALTYGCRWIIVTGNRFTHPRKGLPMLNTTVIDEDDTMYKVKQKGDIITFYKMPKDAYAFVFGVMGFVTSAIVFSVIGATTFMGVMVSAGVIFGLVAAPFYIMGTKVKEVNVNDFEDDLWDNEFDSHMILALMDNG